MGYPAEDRKYTYKDYLETPEDKRFELIEGELIMVPAPNLAHQEILGNLHAVLREIIKENNLGKIFLAPTDVYLDDENVVQPDILFISKARESVMTKKNIKGAPDLVVEILSPNSGYYDLIKKKKLYARYKVAEYLIVEPEEKTVEVHTLNNDTFELDQTFKESDTLISPRFSKFKIDLTKVFD